jgi:hypothetical protein
VGQVLADPEYIKRHYEIKPPAPKVEPASEWHPAKIPVQNFSGNSTPAPEQNGVAKEEPAKENGVNGTEIGGAVQSAEAPVVVEAVKEVASVSEKLGAVTMVESIPVSVVN